MKHSSENERCRLTDDQRVRLNRTEPSPGTGSDTVKAGSLLKQEKSDGAARPAIPDGGCVFSISQRFLGSTPGSAPGPLPESAWVFSSHRPNAIRSVVYVALFRVSWDRLLPHDL